LIIIISESPFSKLILLRTIVEIEVVSIIIVQYDIHLLIIEHLLVLIITELFILEYLIKTDIIVETKLTTDKWQLTTTHYIFIFIIKVIRVNIISRIQLSFQLDSLFVAFLFFDEAFLIDTTTIVFFLFGLLVMVT